MTALPFALPADFLPRLGYPGGRRLVAPQVQLDRGEPDEHRDLGVGRGVGAHPGEQLLGLVEPAAARHHPHRGGGHPGLDEAGDDRGGRARRALGTVLVLDDGRMTRAARVWFVLQHFGVARAAVLNGGFPALPAGSTAVKGEPETPTLDWTPPPAFSSP